MCCDNEDYCGFEGDLEEAELKKDIATFSLCKKHNELFKEKCLSCEMERGAFLFKEVIEQGIIKLL